MLYVIDPASNLACSLNASDLASHATMQKRRRRLPRLPRSFQTGAVLDVEGRRVSFQPGRSRGGDGMSGVLLIPMAVATGVVVIVVAVAVVLVVLFVTVSMRGGQRRGAKRRGETRQELADAHERERVERDRDIAQEQTRQRIDPDR